MAPEEAVSVELEVPFHDCDPLGVVWHGHYYKYLEIARTALLRAFDLDVAQMQELGVRAYVIESRCRYLAALTYGDRVRVSAWFKDVEKHVKIAYEVVNLSTGRRAARGHTILASTDIEGNLLMDTPSSLLARLQRAPRSS